MSFELDPTAVLMHLQELGYYDITSEKLEEFIKDLKSLIKHESVKKKQGLHKTQKLAGSVDNQSEGSSTFPNTTEDSRSPSPPSVDQHLQSKHCKHCRSHSGRQTRERGTAPLQVSRSSSESSVVAGRTVLRECEKYAAQKLHGRDNVLKEKGVQAPKESTQPKPSKTCDCNWRTIGCKNCDENWSKDQNSIKTTKSKENLVPRPKSSFIRTWQATGQPRPGTASQRCDPVTLYHQYQQVWKQQKLPGENNHNDLRWSIREKLLGQEPHPRPLSQASSVSSMNRRQKRL